MKLDLSLVLSLLTLLSLVAGIVWMILQARQQAKDNREKAEETRKREMEKAKAEAEHRTDLTRDISEMKRHMESVDAILGNGSGLKHDVQEVKNFCSACSSKVLNGQETVKAELNGRIDVVESRLNDHIQNQSNGHGK